MNPKKKTYLILGILLPLLLIAGLCIVLLGPSADQTSKSPAKGISILDSKGDPLALAKTTNDILETECWAYLEVVLTEAGEILAEQMDCSPQQALDTMGIRLLDHIVVADGDYVSMAQNGTLRHCAL